MSSNNDTRFTIVTDSQGFAFDSEGEKIALTTQAIEQLIWDVQDSKANVLKALSFGSIGQKLAIFALSKDWKAVKPGLADTDQFQPHYLKFGSQEIDYSRTTRESRGTGQAKQSDWTPTVRRVEEEKYYLKLLDDLLTLIDQDSDKSNNYWRVAVAVCLSVLHQTGRTYKQIVKSAGLGNAKKMTFYINNCKKYSPHKIEAMWLKANKGEKQVIETPATTQGDTPKTAIQAAMEKSADESVAA